MQATLQLSPPSLLTLVTPATTTKNLVLPFRSTSRRAQRCPQLKATSNVTSDPSTIDYSSSATSVFPAEACETIGGEACDVEMYPEVKPEPQAGKSTAATHGKELEDRDYLEYDGPKTVFPAEACDDLGGEFCDPEYQKGVY